MEVIKIENVHIRADGKSLLQILQRLTNIEDKLNIMNENLTAEFAQVHTEIADVNAKLATVKQVETDLNASIDDLKAQIVVLQGTPQDTSDIEAALQSVIDDLTATAATAGDVAGTPPPLTPPTE